MTTSTKAIRVGVKQVVSSVTRIDETTIRDKFSLATDEYNTLLDLATKPRAPRTTKSNTTANNELLTLATDLADKKSKLDNITGEITKLTGERDTLQREVNEILSQLKLK